MHILKSCYILYIFNADNPCKDVDVYVFIKGRIFITAKDLVSNLFHEMIIICDS